MQIFELIQAANCVVAATKGEDVPWCEHRIQGHSIFFENFYSAALIAAAVGVSYHIFDFYYIFGIFFLIIHFRYKIAC